MLEVRNQFGGPLSAAVLIAAAVGLVALAVAARGAPGAEGRLRRASRVAALGAALVVAVATAAPDTWPPVFSSDGDLVLAPGRGGLADWAVLRDQPDSLAAVLLVANVLLYVPLGFFAFLGWQRALSVVAGAVAVSALVEVVQWQALGRVGSTDDLLLNVAGAGVGLVLALPVSRWSHRRR